MSDGIDQFRLTYEISPIILVGGIAENVPGKMTPIISLIQAQDFSSGLLSSGNATGFDDYVAHFKVMAGGTLIENQVGQYPFANQQVAANAIIVQPLRVSLLMIAPAPANGGYPQKLAAFSSLQRTLNDHIIQGGTFTVATPAYLYTSCLLLGIRDVSGGDEKQVQTQWQWDFYQPLLTQAAAQAAQNSLMNRITAQTQVAGDPPSYSGTANAVGQAGGGVSAALVPAARGTGGASVQPVLQPVPAGNTRPGS